MYKSIPEQLKEKNITVKRPVSTSFSIKKEIIDKEGWNSVNDPIIRLFLDLYNDGFLTIKPILTEVGIKDYGNGDLFMVDVLFEQDIED